MGPLDAGGELAERVGADDPVEMRVPPDPSTAGNPTIVFLRGGLEEEGPCACDAGGGVTTGVEDAALSVGGTNP